ncbi:MAG TPA: hypothetical protein VHO90_20995 [Bacteroidales bacterium]|nr:hypothetical protein [Bacteroidales bacterium]
MKKLLVVLAIGLFGMSLFAQKEYVPTKDELMKFKSTKTLVVLEDNPLSDFNVTAKEIMPQEWKITKYDFITWKDFDKLRLDPAYSFILINQVKFQGDKTNAKYNFLSLLMGGTSSAMGDMADLCPVPLSYTGVDEDHYTYKLGVMLRFMQNHVQSLLENPDLLQVNIFKHYNDNIAELKGKTLYLVADELGKDINTVAKIKKYYAGDVKIVTREDIKNAIEERTPNAVFLHKVGPEDTRFKSRCYKILMGIDNPTFYYFDYHMVGSDPDDADAFLLKDLKHIAKK